jgi:hypothetical protein
MESKTFNFLILLAGFLSGISFDRAIILAWQYFNKYFAVNKKEFPYEM